MTARAIKRRDTLIPDTPLITVITATYDSARVLPGLARSLGEQRYRRYEWLVIDGGSTDGTADLIASMGSQVTYTRSESDNGPFEAWNKALDKAQGEWIIFLGADDRIGEGWLEIVAATHRSTDVDLMYGDVLIFDSEAGRPLGTWRGRPWDIMRHELHHIPHPGLAHRARLFADARFALQYRIQADYEFLVRSNIKDGLYVPGITQAIMATGGLSNKPANRRRAYAEARSIQKKHRLTMPVMETLAWWGKLALSYVPRVYTVLQRMRWRMASS